MVLPAFTTDETLLCRAEAYTLLKQYDKAAADIDAWQKAFTKNTTTLTKESINRFYAALSYYTPENTVNPSVKKELHPAFPAPFPRRCAGLPRKGTARPAAVSLRRNKWAGK